MPKKSKLTGLEDDFSDLLEGVEPVAAPTATVEDFDDVPTIDKPPRTHKRGGTRENAGRKPKEINDLTKDAHVEYTAARAKKEKALADMAELEYEIKSGNYLPREDVRQAIATAFATVAQTLRSIPDNIERTLGVSAEIAEEVGKLIDNSMEDLSIELEKIHLENTSEN